MASGLNLKVAQIEPKSDSKSGTVSTETGGAIRPKQVAQIEPYYPAFGSARYLQSKADIKE